MKILAIETSCDDTGIAIIEAEGAKTPVFKVLSNIVSSQQIHANYGGIFPMMAKREHQTNLVPVLTQSLKESRLLKTVLSSLRGGAPRGARRRGNLEVIKRILEKENTLFESVKEFLETHQKPDIDAIAITHGPGLEPCLWVGVNFAKALSCAWDIPVIPVNHIEAHILVNFLPKIKENPKSQILNPKQLFPAVSLVVSGGHTQLILVKKIGDYKIIGETGECFDKCARILNLGYPGGPIISKIASEQLLIRENKQLVNKIQLPRPMINSKDYDFSFSGLKTAVLYHHKKQPQKIQKSKKYIKQMCAEIQQAIIDVLLKKTIKAVKDYSAKSLILGGGVSANKELRRQFERALNNSTAVELFVPDANLSTDNALMPAITGYFHRTKKIAWSRWLRHRGSTMPISSSIPDKVGTKSGQNLEAKANLRI